MTGSIVVMGLGEVGKPLAEVLGKHFHVVGVDVHPVELDEDRKSVV
jgi:UDP-N-acetyl-D-mannosaminuronate dehydrogenase